MARSDIAKEWLEKAEKDYADARFLLENNRSAETISFHIQQAAEKYLKGFLIFNGWRLEKVHDLVKLLGESIKIDNSFVKFNPSMQKITNFYFESRYPVGYEVEYSMKELEECLNEVRELRDIVYAKLRLNRE